MPVAVHRGSTEPQGEHPLLRPRAEEITRVYDGKSDGIPGYVTCLQEWRPLELASIRRYNHDTRYFRSMSPEVGRWLRHGSLWSMRWP